MRRICFEKWDLDIEEVCYTMFVVRMAEGHPRLTACGAGSLHLMHGWVLRVDGCSAAMIIVLARLVNTAARAFRGL